MESVINRPKIGFNIINCLTSHEFCDLFIYNNFLLFDIPYKLCLKLHDNEITEIMFTNY